MRIHCTATFLHGRDRFEEGDTRTVSDEDARYFIGNGWATEIGGDPVESAAGDVTLDIKKSTHAQEASNG